MKKLILVLSCILLSSFSFSQDNNELIVKFKAAKKPNSIEVLRLQKFDNSEIRLLNKSDKIESIALTGNKKEKDTYILELNSSQPIEEIIELYKKTVLFEYVEQNFVSKCHGFPSTPNHNTFNRKRSS